MRIKTGDILVIRHNLGSELLRFHIEGKGQFNFYIKDLKNVPKLKLGTKIKLYYDKGDILYKIEDAKGNVILNNLNPYKIKKPKGA